MADRREPDWKKFIAAATFGAVGIAGLYGAIDMRLDKLESRVVEKANTDNGKQDDRINELKQDLNKIREYVFESRGAQP